MSVLRYPGEEKVSFKSQKGHRAQMALMDAAIPIIAAQGIDGLSVGEMCAKVGLKRTSFYTHYTSVGDFIDALALREYDHFDKTMKSMHGLRSPGLKPFVVSILEIYAMKAFQQTWLTFVLKLVSAHEKTRQRLEEDVRSDVLSAVESGDFQLTETMTDAFVHLAVASIHSALAETQDASNHLANGQSMCELLLRAGGAKKSVSEVVNSA